MSRTSCARSMWSCATPWLKFKRTTSTPARSRRSSTAGSLDAGPNVATILVARVMTGLVVRARGGVSALSRPRHRPPVHDSVLRASLQDFQRGQRLALQHLEERTTAGGDVADVLLDAVPGDRGQRVAAAADAER